jgi:hypothetical protein
MLELQEPYRPRPIRFLEVWQVQGWRFKVYGIAYERELPRQALVQAAKQVVPEQLAHFSAGINQYQVGFLGIHDGRGTNFVFVDFWADENELHHHVFISPAERPEALDYVAPGGVLGCVWDLRVLAFERQAWIDTVLANPRGPDLEAYLAYQLDEEA